MAAVLYYLAKKVQAASHDDRRDDAENEEIVTHAWPMYALFLGS
jgi:hypothetical protein